MKKAKLFMMLALLIMGVSNVMGGTATRTYDVTYVGVPEGEVGGYTINRAYSESGFIFINYTEGVDPETSNYVDILVMKNGQAIGTPSVTNLTNSNYNTYFRPKTIVGYDYSVSIDAVPSGNTHGKITITYTLNLDNVEIGDYIYSTKRWQSGASTNTIQMPEGEVAIALNPRYTDNITNEPYLNNQN